ncbi:hypothetical protein M409DRAFT_30591 [Zasmidium cellare ATCC 36951]|uniref:Zn(2)-C6 fungal-type domain-containing protein n=1 Tax=Zasmidium cellare ATCC 36951 TaxID=1080233 RepID=A0A6A6BZI8_ZASCE|nr:uncharacterized protein M409DRAFT_30591 [Zasmidium cellare ATCC 36951]KAF2158969.1 hypothetical protein M409DRAFT_30591 [Zasmidium cellare ATCC 36951]
MSWKSKARRTAKACDQCQRRKAKCNGETPCCTCDAVGLECSYGVSVKQLRGPAYVAHLENKIGELEAKLQASQSSSADSPNPPCDKGFAANRIITPPETSCSAPDSNPVECENDDQVFEPAASLSLDDELVENTTFIPPDMSDLPPPPEDSFPTWADEQIPIIEPMLTHEMTIPLGMHDSQTYSALQDFDHSIMDDWTAFDRLPLTNRVKRKQDPELEQFIVQTSDVMEQPDVVSDHSSSNVSKRMSNKDRAELRDRNRVAAAKCRSRNKLAHKKLETDARTLQAENTRLNRLLLALRTQRTHLQELALQHDVEPSRQCRCVGIHQYNKARTSPLPQASGIRNDDAFPLRCQRAAGLKKLNCVEARGVEMRQHLPLAFGGI